MVGGFMDLGLIRRAFLKRVRCITLLTCLFVFLCGCDGRAGQYPYDLSASWMCNEPHFVLQYYADEEKSFELEKGLIELPEVAIEVDISFGMGDFWVLPIDSKAYEDRLLSGTWSYRRGDLILKIQEDFLFDHQYSELVLSPVLLSN